MLGLLLLLLLSAGDENDTMATHQE